MNMHEDAYGCIRMTADGLSHFIQASKAQARRVAELEASLAAATELHGAAQVPRPPPRSLPVLPHLHCRTPHHFWMRTPGPWLGLSHRAPCLRFG